MTAGSERVLYIGTAEGLYQAVPDNGGYRARAIGLQGKGALRAPVVIDWRDPRRIYAATSRAGVFSATIAARPGARSTKASPTRKHGRWSSIRRRASSCLERDRRRFSKATTEEIAGPTASNCERCPKPSTGLFLSRRM